jgi:hypothetical protein
MDDIGCALVASGVLKAAEADDRRKVEQALGTLLTDWATVRPMSPMGQTRRFDNRCRMTACLLSGHDRITS